ncbi:MAG TPA: ribosome maturation factor RimM [Propionibacteriaceae bacterium]|nr:ribosome maturation factor RimM [Propionibacteriaceae bacterium]
MAATADPGRTGDDPVEVVVGIVGRAHGLRGDVAVELRTDEPEVRFAAGSVLGCEGLSSRLTVVSARDGAAGRIFVRFLEVPDRTAAEALRGRVLVVRVDPQERPAGDDPEEYYDRQLRGLRVLDADGLDVGVVADVIHLPSQDLLAVTTDAGERLVPFVTDLVPHIDLAAGTARLSAAAAGLLEDVAEA